MNYCFKFFKISFFLLFFQCIYIDSSSQALQLLLRKNGKTIKRYNLGEQIGFTDKKEYPVIGVITFLKRDSIFINSEGFAISEFKELRNLKSKRNSSIDLKTLGLITLGVAVSTAGMYFSNLEDFGTALAYSATIGYGPLLISQLFKGVSFRRKSYALGKKFTLHILDLTMPLRVNN